MTGDKAHLPHGGAIPHAPGGGGVGGLLRKRREEAGLSVDEVAARLRIKPGFIDSIEGARFWQIPQGPYAIGFVRSYARLVGLDADKILADFKQEAAGITGKPDLAFPEPPGVRRLPAPWLAGLCGVMAVVVAGVWFVMGRPDRSAVSIIPPVPESAPSPSPGPAQQASLPMLVVLPAAPTEEAAMEKLRPAAVLPAPLPMPPAPMPGVSATEAPELPASGGFTEGGEDDTGSGWPSGDEAQPRAVSPPAAAVPPAAPASYGVGEKVARAHVKAVSDSWIQVVDGTGRVLFSRLLKAGEVYHVPPLPGVNMTTGNAGGIEITVNGRVLPPAGVAGQVVRDITLDSPKHR